MLLIRSWMKSGFIDTFRYFYPDKEGAYSWWSYMGKARENNTGWRIDYFLCSKSLQPYLKDAFIYPHIFGSDHCPVGLDFVMWSVLNDENTDSKISSIKATLRTICLWRAIYYAIALFSTSNTFS